MTSQSAPSMRKFMILWVGQLISILGSGLTSFALAVWIYEQTGQATPFALTVLMGSLPAVLLSPIAGSFADRFNRKALIIIADTGAAVFSLIVAVLLFSGQLQIWHVFLLVLFGSALGAFQEPAYLAIIPQLVPKEQLGRANGLGQLSQAVQAMVAPVLAGALYLWIGLEGILLIDMATYFFAIGGMLLVTVPRLAAPAIVAGQNGLQTVLADVQVGLGFLWQRKPLLGLIAHFSLTNFLLNLTMVLYGPMVLAFATSAEYGLVQSLSGVGMLVGSIIISVWGGPKQRIPAIILLLGAAGLSTAVMGLQPNVIFPTVGFFLLMFIIPIASGMSQAVWQIKVPTELQGRVASVRIMISRGLMPLAFLIAGPLADQVFDPLMAAEGVLGRTILGQVLGVGPGRGIALLFVLGGLLLFVISMGVFTVAPIRNLERTIPDALPDDQQTESTVLDDGPIQQPA